MTQAVDQHGNVIPSDQKAEPDAETVNGVSNENPAAADALGNANGHSDKKRPSQSQDISLHNLSDFN
jgi:amidophosphoribosyltransferase